MVLSQFLAANVYRRQKSLSPIQPFNFKFAKTEYNEVTKLFKLNYLNGGSDYNIMTRSAVAFVSYAAKYERR